MQKLSENEILVLCTCDNNGKSHNNFQWPLKVGATVETSDWNHTSKYENGLQGLPWGIGNISFLLSYHNAIWILMVVDITKDYIHINEKMINKCKFKRGRIWSYGKRDEIIEELQKYAPENTPIPFVKIIGGDNSTLTGGDYSTLNGGAYSIITGGDYSTLDSGAYSIITGGNYSTSYSGDRSKITIGDYSSSFSLNNSKLIGGNNSTLTSCNNSELIGGNNSILTSGNYSSLTSGNNSKLTGGRYSVYRAGEDSVLISRTEIDVLINKITKENANKWIVCENCKWTICDKVEN